ncbi:MAG: PaaI family thioesterase [Bacteroidota bacterium]
MKKIRNPFTVIPDYKCFGCAPHNELGMQMEFYVDGDDVVSFWNPPAHLQGWINVLHGGIQAALMDEVAYWVVYAQLKTSGVTSRIEAKLSKPVFTNKGALKIVGRLIEMKRNIAVIDTAIFDHEGKKCVSGTVHYFTYPKDIAKEKLWYPSDPVFEEE